MFKKIGLICFYIAFIASCSQDKPGETAVARACTVEINSCNASDQCTNSASLQYGNNFKTWMTNNGYASMASGRGWGGGSSGACAGVVSKTPVIFVHGNGGSSESYASAKNYLLATGYNECEIYAVSYQKDNIEQPTTYNNYYSASRIAWVRNFIKAVLQYTGKTQVDVVGWSMGVNIARKAITGGTAYADTAATITCPLGASLASNIKTFVGLAGASYGVPSCAGGTNPNCSNNGLKVDNTFQLALNGGYYGGSVSPQPLASAIYSMYSNTDSYICDDDTQTNNDIWQPYNNDLPNCTYNGVHISHIPGQTASINVDSILPFTPPYNSTTNYMVDHLSIGSYAKAMQLLYYILQNNPNQTDLQNYYNGL